jgi:hypothetical protein
MAVHQRVFPVVFPQFRGLSKLWNSIVIHASHDHVLMLNDDIMINDTGFLENICSAIRKNHGRTFLINRSWSHFLVSRQELDDLGYFDERLLGIGEEDGDMTWRYIQHFEKPIPSVRMKSFVNYAEETNSYKPVNIRTHSGTKYSLFNRRFIFSEKYAPDPGGIQGMFDEPVILKNPGKEQYPNERFYRERRDELGVHVETSQSVLSNDAARVTKERMNTQQVTEKPERMIITAASAAFGPSLLALLGSLNLNWPDHPPVRVYDIGLDEYTLGELKRNKVDVVPVPPFCSHWRKHFTWKTWCWNDAPARDILWIDSGVVVLQPMGEVFDAIDRLGYFAVPTYHLLTENASLNACRGCGVEPSFRKGKMTLAGTVIGFKKQGLIGDILREALSIAEVEEYIASVEKTHRHDQMIISLLLHKHLRQVIMSDGIAYCGWMSPRQTPGQKVWVHRRALMKKDQAYLASRISTPGEPFMPSDPVADRSFRSLWKKIFGPPEKAIRRAIKGDRNKEEIYDGVRDS